MEMFRCSCEQRPSQPWYVEAKDGNKPVILIGCQSHVEQITAQMKEAGFVEIALRPINPEDGWSGIIAE